MVIFCNGVGTVAKRAAQFMTAKYMEEVVENLLTKEALEKPIDAENPERADFHLPEWYDDKQFNKARRFYWSQSFAMSTSMLVGLVTVFAVPSILKVLMDSRRSSSVYTAYKRYLSTMLHTVSWFEHELKPGSISWKSVKAVRSRHYRAGLSAKSRGNGIVSQRDVAITQFGFLGLAMLKPDKFGITQTEEGDWEAYNHFWRVIGYMIGLEDRYNICRNSVEETREVCQELLERVFTPCLENVPEYFEHMANVMLDGMGAVVPSLNIKAAIYFTKHVCDVPGYVYTEQERITFQTRLSKALKGKPIHTGVDVTTLMRAPAVEGLPETPPRLLYYRDYEVMHEVPAYKRLTFGEKLNLNFAFFVTFLYTTYLGKIYFNLQYRWNLFFAKYLPYLSFVRFGIRASYVNIFVETPKDDTKPIKNAEYYKSNSAPTPWYRYWFNIL